MTIKPALQTIIHYLQRNRGKGSTTAMMMGVLTSSRAPIVLTTTRAHADWLKTEFPAYEQPQTEYKALTFEQLAETTDESPLVLDNHTVMQVAEAALQRIERLEQLVATYESKLRQIEKIAHIFTPENTPQT